MLTRGVAADVAAGERVAIAGMMGARRCMRDGARSYWTFVATGGLGIERMMVIEVPICGRIWASS